MKLNDLTSNNIYNQNMITTSGITSTITTSNTITTQNLNSNFATINTYFIARNITAAYLSDGAVTGQVILYPIVCSTKNLRPSYVDDAYIVNAGYKLELFVNPNYAGSITYTFDNTNGATMTKYNLISPNTTASLKVYFLNQEITLPDMSY